MEEKITSVGHSQRWQSNWRAHFQSGQMSLRDGNIDGSFLMTALGSFPTIR